MGIACSGVGISSIFFFPVMQHVIVAISWREACWILAGTLCVFLFPLNVIFQRRHTSDLNLQPDGDAASDEKKAGPAEPSNIVDPDCVAIEWTVTRAMRTSRFGWLFTGYYCALYIWYDVQVHQAKFFIETCFSAEQAAYAPGLVGLTGIVGQIGLGHLSDRIGREWAWTAAGGGYALCYVVLLLLLAFPNALLFYVIVGSQGLLGYGITLVIGAIPAKLFEGKRFSTIFGMLSISAGLGASTSPWLTGYFFDRYGNYEFA